MRKPSTIKLRISPSTLEWLQREAAKRHGTQPAALSLLVSGWIEDMRLWRTAKDSSTVLARLRALQPWVEELGGVIVHRNPVVSRELKQKPETED